MLVYVMVKIAAGKFFMLTSPSSQTLQQQNEDNVKVMTVGII
jgi:hypothetical protein